MSDYPDTILNLLRAYGRGDLSPVEVVEGHIDLIAARDHDLNSFSIIDHDGAITAAHQSANRWHRNEPHRPLEGVPVTVSDNVAMAGSPTRHGSKAQRDRRALVDSPVVARLKEAGAIIIGKTTTSEFGWKGVTDSPLHGVTRNPWDRAQSAGGGSGGAAASLAAGLGTLAHLADSSGSALVPGSYCGLVALKPSYGRVPHAPIESLFDDLVVNCPMARSVEDTALSLNIFSRPDIRDWRSAPADHTDWRMGLNDGASGLRIAFSHDLGGVKASPEVAEVCHQVSQSLAAEGANIVSIGPVIKPLRPDFERYWQAHLANKLRSVPRDRLDSLDPGFLVAAEPGLSVTLDELNRAHLRRSEMATRLRRLHLEFDVLLTPTTPTTAIGAESWTVSDGVNPAADQRWDLSVPYTWPFTLTGQPALSVPVGRSLGGLPIAIQVVATHFREDLTLRMGRVLMDLAARHVFRPSEKPPAPQKPKPEPIGTSSG